MPSYYLPCKANLGDVQFTDLSRKNLYIGNFDTTYADNVDIKNGSIAVQNLQFQGPYDSNLYNNFLRCRIHHKNMSGQKRYTN